MGNVKWKSAGYICNEIKLTWSLFVTKIHNRKNKISKMLNENLNKLQPCFVENYD